MNETSEAENTDREIWREREGDYYADSIHVTKSGGIGIDCGGHVIVMPLRKWFEVVAWSPIETAPHGEPVLVTSAFWPGWFDIGGQVLGEWRRGQIAGDKMAHEPTHWMPLRPVAKRHPH